MLDRPMLRGNQLLPEDQKYALAAFVHRFTRDHKPDWAKEPRLDGRPYKVQFASDQDWLANTDFYVTKKGRINRAAGECYSHPTWPEGEE